MEQTEDRENFIRALSALLLFILHFADCDATNSDSSHKSQISYKEQQTCQQCPLHQSSHAHKNTFRLYVPDAWWWKLLLPPGALAVLMPSWVSVDAKFPVLLPPLREEDPG